MKISILISDPGHPVNSYIDRWVEKNNVEHKIQVVRRKSDLCPGDILFLISCSEIIGKSDRDLFGVCLVLHASDLPLGRGWSPHIWEVSNGAKEIVLSLIEAEDLVDSGRIWRKTTIPIPDHYLWNEINHLLFTSEIDMIDFSVREIGNISPVPQLSSVQPTYYRRRTEEDSRIDPYIDVASQFDKLRVADPNRFPSFFDYRGHRYKIILEKFDD